MSGADILFPTPVVVGLGGRKVEVLPLRIENLVRFSRAIRPALPKLMTGQLQLAAEDHFEDLRAALAIATDATPEEISNAWGDEFVDLLGAVMQVNLDFFVNRLAPALQRLVPVVIAMRPNPTSGSSSRPSSTDGDTTAAPLAP